MKNKRIIFEFMGLPASGKTTALNNIDISGDVFLVSTESYYDFQHKYNKAALILNLICFICFHPILSLKISSLIKCKNKLKQTLSFLFYMSVFFKFIARHRHNVVIFDQGLLQFYWSLYWNDVSIEYKSFIKTVKLLNNYFRIYPVFFIGDYKEYAKRSVNRKSDCYVDHLYFEDALKLYNKLSVELVEISKLLDNSIIFAGSNDLEHRIKEMLEKNESTVNQ